MGGGVVAVLIVLVVRAGLYWQAAAGSTAFVVLRKVAPWLAQLWPFARKAWQRRSTNGRAPTDGSRTGPTMSRAEALSVLGLHEGASEGDVERASRELLSSGTLSPFLVQQVSEARRALLERRA